jgi:hypothetical protein
MADDDFEIVELQEGQAAPTEEATQEPAEKAADDSVDDNDADDSADDNDAEGSEASNEKDDREAIRERRRIERLQKKLNRREYERRDKNIIGQQQAIIQELQQRLSTVERTTSASQMAQLDNAISEAENFAVHNERLVQQAIESGNGAVAAKAMKDWNMAQNRANELKALKQNYVRSSQQPTTMAVDPSVRQNTEAWTRRNSWFDTSGRDLDSRIALQIDDQLAKDGFDPRFDDYWEELDNRIAQYLPHRAAKVRAPSPQRPKSPVQGSGKSSNPSPSGKKTVYLSPARVQAIKDAGAWEDTAARNRMIKAYQDYDRNSKS